MRRALPLLVLVSAVTTPALGVRSAAADPTPLTVTSFAGGGVSDNGHPATAAIRASGLVSRPGGGYFASDLTHNRVRAVSADGTTITTYAGSGEQVDGHGAFSGDGGPATSAQLYEPTSLALLPNGDLALIDSGSHRVRLVSAATGVITTIAGNGSSGTGVPSTDATTQPLTPSDIAYDATAGTLDIADATTGLVWAWHADGSLSLVAGGGATSPGDGGAATDAKLFGLSGLAVQPNGDLLISEGSLGRVRLVHAGVISTVAGLADANDGSALHMSLPNPGVLRVRNDGTVFVTFRDGIASFQVGGDHANLGTSGWVIGGFDPTGHTLVLLGAVLRQEAGSGYTRLIGSDGATLYQDVTVPGQAATDAPLTPTGGLAVIGGDTYVTSTLTVDRIDHTNGKVYRELGDTGPVTPGSSAWYDYRASRFTGIVPASGGGFYANDNGHLVKSDGVTFQPWSGQSPDPSGITEGQSAAKLSYVGPMASAGDDVIYFGAGRVLARLGGDQKVHVIAQDIQSLGGAVPNAFNAEYIQSVALTPAGKLLVLSDEGEVSVFYPKISSRVRLVDPADGTATTLYYGPQLSALTAAADGRVFVAEKATKGVVIDELGPNGSTARIAGGGHVTGATQAATDLFLNEVGGLGVGADGSLLLASPTAQRLLAVPVAGGFTAPAPVTNVQLFSAPDGTGYTQHTVTWDGALPAGSHIEIGVASGGAGGPITRLSGGAGPSGSSAVFHMRENGSRWVYSVYVVSGAGEQSAPVTIAGVAAGDTTAPPAATLSEAFSADSTLTMTWNKPFANDLAGYELRVLPGTTAPTAATTPSWSGTAIKATISGLTVGQQYTLLLSTKDYSGNAADVVVPFVAGQVPGVTLLSPSPAEKAFTGPNVAFYPYPTTKFGGLPTCGLDGAPVDCSGSKATLTNLAAGAHTFTTYLHTTLGDGPTLTRHFTVDRTAPTLAVTALPPFTLASSATVTWKATETGSGVATYKYRYQKAAAAGAFGTFTAPVSTTAAKAVVAMAAGYTYCFQVQAIDKAGNASAFSASRCTTRPLDDTGLTASRGWARSKASAYYGTTIVQTKTKGAQLTKTATFRQLALVVTTCPTCGTINVYSGGTLLKSINLASSTTRRQVLIVLPVVSNRTAAISIRVTSTNKSVLIDGLGIARA